MSDFTIGNACNISINMQQGTVPNMGDSLRDWFQPTTFGLITKSTVGFQLNEEVEQITFWGIVQPLNGRNLTMMPEGQRKWNWLSVHAQASPNGAILDLDIDDVVEYNGIQYRVMASKDYSLYSYFYYELCENYTGNVPTP